MAVLKCKMCGGSLEINEGMTVCECEYCGTQQTITTSQDENMQALFNRANILRMKSEFDKAEALYEKLVQNNPDDAEAHWGLILCKFGIEYVEDPATFKRIPTCHRTSFDSIIADEDYKEALRCADTVQRSIYEAEAKEIDRLQKEILALSAKEEPYDVFICYKESDNGTRTPDSVIANDIYHQLTNEGFKVFYAAITLESKLGSAYEPCIFAALNSAKVMLAIGTKPEYFNAVWVKNEWSRYLKMMKKDRSKLLIPCYKDMDAYELPEEFAHLQAQDMSKIGFINDIVRGIKKVIVKDEPKAAAPKAQPAAPVPAGNPTANSLVKRAFIFLEDGDWSSADEYCEKALDIDPENAQAYLGKLMAELQVARKDDLKNQAQPFDGRNNFQKAVRFGSEQLRTELFDDIRYIKERNEQARIEGIYTGALNAMKRAKDESEYKSAAYAFKTIPGYKDADALAEQCEERADELKKHAEYKNAVTMLDSAKKNYQAGYEALDILSVNAAISELEKIKPNFVKLGSYKKSAEYVAECDRLKEEWTASITEIERRIEAEKRAAEIARKKRKKKITIVLLSVGVLIVLAILIFVFTYAIPESKYQHAIELTNNGQYESALVEFESIANYGNTSKWILYAKYMLAEKYYDEEKYEEAKTIYEELGDYSDSVSRKVEAEEGIEYLEKYNKANKLYEEGKYDEAITAFKALDGYKDSEAQITKCETAINYNAAVELYNTGKYEEAYKAFDSLNYRDSSEKAAECLFLKQKAGLTNVTVGSTIKFGFYEQDNNTSNGKEEIEWKVLAVEGNKALVISQYALDCQKYNSTYTDTTWEKCSLRTWLNGTFYNAAFGADHQEMIISSTVSADKNPSYGTSPGNSTTDKVFLLSIPEVNKYFSSDSACQCQGTEECYAQGAYEGSNGNCWWWLRSPGDHSYYAAVVGYDGSVIDYGNTVSNDNDAVRPALWIDLEV